MTRNKFRFRKVRGETYEQIMVEAAVRGLQAELAEARRMIEGERALTAAARKERDHARASLRQVDECLTQCGAVSFDNGRTLEVVQRAQLFAKTISGIYDGWNEAQRQLAKVTKERDQARGEALVASAHQNEDLKEEVVRLSAELLGKQNRLKEVCEAAASVGWNGIENPKSLEEFIRRQGKDLDTLCGVSEEWKVMALSLENELKAAWEAIGWGGNRPTSLAEWIRQELDRHINELKEDVKDAVELKDESEQIKSRVRDSLGSMERSLRNVADDVERLMGGS